MEAALRPFPDEHSRWLHFILLADLIEARLGQGRPRVEELRVFLASAEEVFGQERDPLRDFPAYAVAEFCRKMNRALAEMEAGRGEK